MKTNAIVRIVIFSLLIIILGGMLIGGIVAQQLAVSIGSGLTNFHLFTDSIDGTRSSSGSVNPDVIQEMEIEWISGSITIQPGDTDQITFQENSNLNENEKMIWNVSNGKLNIHYSQNNVFFGFSIDRPKDLVITVPRGWIGQELDIESVSAEIDVSDMTFNSIDLENVSGKCDFTGCTADVLTVDTVSGGVDFSGPLNVLNCSTVSANCSAKFTNIPQKAELDSVSGNLTLTLPSEAGFMATIDSVSGGIQCDFLTGSHRGNTYIYGDTSMSITADTISGDLIILEET